MPSFVDHERPLFSDGEELTADDLNDAGAAAVQSAWEWPGYGSLLPHALVSASSYDWIFSTAEDLDTMVFSVGAPFYQGAGGDPFAFTFGAGLLGLYVGSAQPAAGDPKLRWILVDNGAGATPYVFAAAPAGQLRTDLVTLAIAEIDDTAGSRDFKDAVTGALTTNPTAATPGGGLQPPPTPVAGRHAVALVIVSDSGIVQVQDLTYPLGPGHTYLSRPRADGIFYPNVWLTDDAKVIWDDLETVRDKLNDAATDATKLVDASDALGNIIARSLDVARLPASALVTGTDWPGGAFDPITDPMKRVILLPGPYAGDGGARLLGLEVTYKLPTALTAYLAEVDLAGTAPTVTSIADLSATIVPSATPVTKRLDLRGYPFSTALNRGPFWGHGGHAKALQTPSAGKSLALVLEPTAAPAVISWAKWYFAKG
jgi:hypothetical protein